ncbi:MAG: fused MFS/spermidine synthase [Planctomycetota bacterium]
MLCAFFFSGLASLIHEIVWTRLLRLVMGNTTFTITTVLGVFMSGLALGSYVGGRLIDRRHDPLRVFAFLEGAIGLYCLALPWLIDTTEPVYRLVYQHTEAPFYVFSLIRFFFCGLLLLIPATFMGATLPVLTRFFVRSSHRVGWPVGTLYAVNTFGAVVGVGATGFLLIPSLGVSKTIYLACLLNLAICGFGYVLHRRSQAWPPPAAAEDASPPSTGPGEIVDRRPKRSDRKPTSESAADRRPVYGRRALVALLVGYGLSGFAALVYEIAWTRVLSLLIVSSVYAFSLMLTAFILGLAVGSMAYARYVDRVRDPMRALAAIQVAIGVSALAVVPVFGRMPFVLTGMISRLGESFWLVQLAQFGLILLIMLVPTTLMGAAFPLASRLFVQRSETVGRSVGTVYASNTLGSILGSFIGGFVLIPWFGIQQTLFAAVSANILVGCMFVGLSRSLTPARRGLAVAAVIVVVASGLAWMPAWDASRMSLGPFATAWQLPEELARSDAALERIAARDKVLLHNEGLSATITVKEDPQGVLTLLVNGVPEASSVGRLHQQELLAHIPLLLHPDPRRALVIGLASGMTLGSAGRHPLETLDCVELSPGVVEATRLFGPYNYDILDDPRVRVIITDGRNHLALARAPYDVIISQPSNLWIAGVADLFTREFFELCHERLSPRGIACIWFETATIDQEVFRSIVRTFSSVFQTITIWQASRSDFLLIGSKGALAVDHQVLARRMSEDAVASDLKRINIETVPDFLSALVMGEGGARRLAEGARLHTDDNALLEFSAPRGIGRKQERLARMMAMEQHREADLSFLTGSDADRETLTALKQDAARFIEAKGHVAQARWHLGQGRQTEAIAELRSAALLRPSDVGLQEHRTFLLDRAGELVRQREFEDAIERYRLLLTIDPRYELAHYGLGHVLAQTGRAEEALEHLREAARLKPDWPTPLNGLAWLLATNPDSGVEQGREAVRLAQQAAALTQNRDASVLDTLAAAYAAAGEFEKAVSTAQRAVALASAARVDALVIQIRKRLELYRQQKPFRESLPSAASGDGGPGA